MCSKSKTRAEEQATIDFSAPGAGNTILGGGGSDYINAGDGDDTTDGQEGQDRIGCGPDLQDACRDGERECGIDCEAR